MKQSSLIRYADQVHSKLLYDILCSRCYSVSIKSLVRTMDSPRVLSVQSHVVSGYVGNKSAVFPMQLLGFEVDNINSVQFSNHTGYECVRGQVLTEKELAELYTGLKFNDIHFYTHLLTGYIGSPCLLQEIVQLLTDLREKNPNLVYVCDPVMGDNGHIYVPKELLPIYKNSIVRLASIITPNLFETELLTDTKIDTVDDIWKSINILHQMGCETVVISSAELSQFRDRICVFASTRKGTPLKLKMCVKKLPVNFTGTGDLFTALLLSFTYLTNDNLKESLEKTVAALQAVLKRTMDYLEGIEVTPRNKELKLIQSKDDILNPKVIDRAEIIT